MCYDVLSYLRDNVVLWSTNSVPAGGEPARGKSVEASAADLHTEIARLSTQQHPNSPQGIVVTYFCETTNFLVMQTSGIEASREPFERHDRASELTSLAVFSPRRDI